jgi:hypothetical protein
MNKVQKIYRKLKDTKYKFNLMVFTLFATLSTNAHAASGTDTGLIKVLKNLMELFKVGGETIIVGAFAMGLASVSYGFYLFRSAGEPNGQNKGVYFQIVLFFVAGAGLLYLGTMGVLAGQTLLGSDAKVGTSINSKDFGL